MSDLLSDNRDDRYVVSVNDASDFFDEVGCTRLSLRTLLLHRRPDGISLDGWLVEPAGDQGWIISRSVNQRGVWE